MTTNALATWLLVQETRALLTRLDRIKPLALVEAMVPAAALSPQAQVVIERRLAAGKREVGQLVYRYLRWLHSEQGERETIAEAQRRFAILRLRFNAVLSQFDIFADVLTQRSEHETGVWLAGLDVVAADALALPGAYYRSPPVICYLDRGHGAAIRRARTRLPGGGENPVAIIRVPRERMVGSGIASSLVHEVGHQGAALLGLVDSLRPMLRGLQHSGDESAMAWQLWERWISEIVADFWSVARVGVAASMGLMGVMSLPRAFVFRISQDDPHPIPWIRVKLSCALGNALYPHPQWKNLDATWEAYYPLDGLAAEKQRLLRKVETSMPALVALLVNHRPRSLRGKSLVEVLAAAERHPVQLQGYFDGWRRSQARMWRTPPALAFAVVGQARADGRLGPEEESRLVGRLLTHWALRSTLDMSAICVTQSSSAPQALPLTLPHRRLSQTNGG